MIPGRSSDDGIEISPSLSSNITSFACYAFILSTVLYFASVPNILLHHIPSWLWEYWGVRHSALITLVQKIRPYSAPSHANHVERNLNASGASSGRRASWTS